MMEPANEQCQASPTSLSNLNLEKIKTEYTNALELMCSNQSKDEEPYLISMTNKQDLIKNIWKEEIKSMDNKSYKNIYSGKFDVITNEGEFNIKVKHKGQFKLMLPYEQLFDTLWPVHLIHCHNVPDYAIEMLQKKYFVPAKAIHELEKHCSICKAHYTKMLAQPYYCCHLDLIAMETCDHSFNAIMVYQDVCTDFIHLRPLTATNTETQICLELFKIFMDFGPPKELNISCPIFELAINKFKKLTVTTPFDIKLVRKERREKEMLRIKALLQKWSEDSKSNNWAIGCYALQHQLNSEIQGNRESAAFEKVFMYNTSLKNIAKYNESDTESDKSNEELDATLDASSSKIGSKEGSTFLVDDSLKSDGLKERPAMIWVANSSNFGEPKAEPVDTQSAEELDDIPLKLEFKEEQETITELSSDGSNCVNLVDERDDVSDNEYPKCVGIQIDDSSDDMFDDEDSKYIEFTVPGIILKDDNARSSELKKESDAVVLKEEDLKSLDCVEMHSKLEPIFSDNVSKCVEISTKQVTILDIPKSDEETKESVSKIQAEPIAILPDAILNPDELTKQPDAILTADFLVCHEVMEVEPEPILGVKDPKCVEIKTDSNVILDDKAGGKIKENLDVTIDDSECHDMEAEPEITKSDKDPKCIETNTTLNDNILKHGEVTEESNLILNNDNADLDRMDIDSEAILSDKDPKSIEMHTNTTVNDNILKHSEVTEKSTLILNYDNPDLIPDRMDVDSEAILSDKDPKSIEMHTNTTVNDNILKHGEVTKESNLTLNNDNPDLIPDRMDVDSNATLSEKDAKCVQAESNAATLDDDTSKQSKLIEEPTIVNNDNEELVAKETDNLEIDELKEEVNERLKVDSSEPTGLKESDAGKSLTTQLDSPKPSTSGLTSNVDYDSDDSDIVIVNKDPLA